MTQDVQPLTWQKRTNLEEHQQFFSKINEIIANLAPTVDEAEAAIAQATQAIADANAAIATANAASAAADAAAQQAQTAANTVAGYDTRLTAAEGDIDDLQAANQQMGFNITTLANRVTATETKNSQQDTAIGALQTADGQNVKINAINQYAVGLTGNQDYNGIKRALQKIVKKVNFAGTELPTNYWIDNRLIEVAGNDDVPIISIGAERGNTAWSTRINLSIWGESNPDTGRISNARIIFIFDESNRNIRMQVGYTDNQGSPTLYNQQQTLFSW